MAQGTRRSTTWRFSSVVVAILVLYAALWVLYRGVRRDLESSVAVRLESLAALVGSTLTSEALVDAWERIQAAGGEPDSIPALLLDPAVTRVQAPLGRLRDVVDAANVTLFDWNAAPFLDLVSFSPELLQFPQSFADVEVRAALLGGASHSPLYRSGRQYLMSAYARVPALEADAGADDAGVGFVVGIEVDAAFFAVLERLRSWLAAVAAISISIVFVLGVLFSGVQARLTRAEAAIQRAETLAAMGRMTAGIAHEIRNPLGIIRATAARLKKRYDDPQHADERFDYITEEVDRLDAILSGYLAFAKDGQAQVEERDLVPLVHKALHILEAELTAARIVLQVDMPESCTLRADEQRIKQLILNIVLNSVQAMPDGGTLRVRLDAGGRDAVLRFEDSGPGFPQLDRDRLLDPFFTTREKGSGLGLSVVQSIVEQHGGRVELGDAAGGGARVDVYLPRP
jgi:signal transduction histidine kinase